MSNANTCAQRLSLTGAMFVSLLLGTSAFAQATGANAANSAVLASQGASAEPGASKSASAAMKHVKDATAIVPTLRADPKMDRLLQQAQGVFLMPSYTRVALGLGGGGGAGLLLARLSDGSWSQPAFFHVGAISVGVQVGAEWGPAVLVLNSTKAVDHFMKPSPISLNADVGLTVVNWSVAASNEIGDIVAWTSRAGLFGNAVAVNFSDVLFSEQQTNAFYGQQTQLADVLAGRVKTDKADALQQVLAPAPQ